MHKSDIKDAFMDLQDHICSRLEVLDEAGKFQEDVWERPGGGGGRTRIIQGKHIEKGGVNFSAVSGNMPEKITKALNIGATEFFATGVSIVLHPKNPHVPIIHMNVRYFETTSGLWWFGGGIDLTPHYVDEALAADFHNSLKATCDKHDSNYYPEFKKWADDYFYIKHRKETRGIGGIFFDRLNEERGRKQDLFKFVSDVGYAFPDLYTNQFESNYQRSFSEQEKEWQLHRRGRYVEFNLVWDRGTKFGLDTDGNIESILMSLPANAQWTYKYEAGEKEQLTLDKLKKGIDWAD
jgi:coproporphyrinogen III oxidase